MVYNSHGVFIMMRIMIPVKEGKIETVFENSTQFYVYAAEGGQILHKSEVVSDKAPLEFIKALKADACICDAIEDTSRQTLTQSGIAVFHHAQGSPDSAISALFMGQLGTPCI